MSRAPIGLVKQALLFIALLFALHLTPLTGSGIALAAVDCPDLTVTAGFNTIVGREDAGVCGLINTGDPAQLFILNLNASCTSEGCNFRWFRGSTGVRPEPVVDGGDCVFGIFPSSLYTDLAPGESCSFVVTLLLGDDTIVTMSGALYRGTVGDPPPAVSAKNVVMTGGNFGGLGGAINGTSANGANGSVLDGAFGLVFPGGSGDGGSGSGSGTASFSGLPLALRDLGNGVGFNIDVFSLLTALNVTASLDDVVKPELVDQAVPPRFGFSVSGDYVSFSDDNPTADRDGDAYRLAAIGTWRSEGRGTIGAYFSYEEGDVSSRAIAARLERQGIGGGVLASLDLPQQMELLVELGYLHFDNDAAIAGATGSFNSGRFNIHGQLKRHFVVPKGFWADVSLDTAYINNNRDSYTDSTGTAVSGATDEQASLGGSLRVGRNIEASGPVAAFRPWVEFGADWNYANEGRFAATAVNVFTSPNARFDAGGGAELAFHNGSRVTAQGSYFTTDTDLEGWTVSSGLAVPLSAVMPQASFARNGGTFAFDIAQRPEASKFMATINLPLN